MMNEMYAETKHILTDILGEELSQQLQSTMRQASDGQLIELRDSLQVLFQWLREQAGEQQAPAV